MYDKDLAQKACDWFPRYLKHTKGRWAGEAFELLPWQEEIIRPLYGTIKQDGTRLYRTVYVEIPKKNGKSELAAGIALRGLFADGEPGAEVYSAAADKDQATIVFDVAANMVRMNDRMGERCKIIDSTKRIVHNTNQGAYYRALSSDVKTKHGFNASTVVFDELHAQPNRDLWDVLTKGSGAARLQALIFAITTAGYDRNSICWEMHEYARKVLAGLTKDPTFLAIMFSADESDDWTDESVWAKANPSLGPILQLDDFRAACNAAQENPAEENIFRRLRLNQWVKQETRYIPMKKWAQCDTAVVEEDLRGLPCYAGLDLASTTDVAALVLLFRVEDMIHVLCRFWIPEETMVIRSKRDGVNYDLWEKQGYITATPGSAIDFVFIQAEIEELAGVYEIQEVGYDPWNCLQTAMNLEAEGFEMVKVPQGYKGMSEPSKELLRLVLKGRLAHGNNPVLTWMADNVVVTLDPYDNVRPDKKKSTEKIDGMVAMIMAMGRLMLHKTVGPSVYETRGVVVA